MRNFFAVVHNRDLISESLIWPGHFLYRLTLISRKMWIALRNSLYLPVPKVSIAVTIATLIFNEVFFFGEFRCLIIFYRTSLYFQMVAQQHCSEDTLIVHLTTFHLADYLIHWERKLLDFSQCSRKCLNFQIIACFIYSLHESIHAVSFRLVCTSTQWTLPLLNHLSLSALTQYVVAICRIVYFLEFALWSKCPVNIGSLNRDVDCGFCSRIDQVCHHVKTYLWDS